MNKETRTWYGDLITVCQLCKAPIQDTFIDGRVRKGGWVIMCPSCWIAQELELGIGNGQLYIKTWEKV